MRCIYLGSTKQDVTEGLDMRYTAHQLNFKINNRLQTRTIPWSNQEAQMMMHVWQMKEDLGYTEGPERGLPRSLLRETSRH